MNFSLPVRQATRQLKQNDMSFTDVLTIVATQRHMTVNKSPVVIAEKKMFEKFEHKKKKYENRYEAHQFSMNNLKGIPNNIQHSGRWGLFAADS